MRQHGVQPTRMAGGRRQDGNGCRGVRRELRGRRIRHIGRSGRDTGGVCSSGVRNLMVYVDTSDFLKWMLNFVDECELYKQIVPRCINFH